MTFKLTREIRTDSFRFICGRRVVGVDRLTDHGNRNVRHRWVPVAAHYRCYKEVVCRSLCHRLSA